MSEGLNALNQFARILHGSEFLVWPSSWFFMWWCVEGGRVIIDRS